ncbi:hypothetical protein ACLOJK_014284 [Asimina triloba]
MASIDLEGILTELPNDGQVPKTKIVCTLGPASRSVPMIEKLLRAGMNVARFNFSHGTHEYHQETLNNLRIAMHNTQILCAVMLDTKGPEIRTGFLKDGRPIQLKEGQEITVSTDYDIKGDTNMISMSYKKLATDLRPGNTILCADGTITLTVLSCDPAAGTVRCRCENTAMLGERKNVNLPGIVVDLPTLTEKDKEDILGWGVPNNIDLIALSFVRKGSDLVHVRQVENQEGVVNFDEILRETDSFMVARGDLGMEIPVEKIFLAQKMMIYKCNLLGKSVVTATQMLESMIKSPRPTRAEATDVANAVIDGTDCVMLSGESAAGAYPDLAVKIMARICVEAESSLDYRAIFKEMIRSTPLPMSPLESLASSAVRVANKSNAKLIVVLTRGGTTARLVAKYRPAVPVLSVVVPVLTTDSFDWTISDETPARHSLIYRGLIPLLAEGSAKATDAESTEAILDAALKSATARGLCKPSDAVVALHRIGAASIVKICVVKEKEGKRTRESRLYPNAVSMPVRRFAFGRPEEARHPDSIRAALAEFISTLVFVFAGEGSVLALGKMYQDTSPASGLVGVAVAHALALFVAVSIAFNNSGGHVNPAVTFGALLGGRISLLRAVFYWVAQLLGAIVASLLLRVTDGMRPMGFAVASGVGVWHALILEIVMTFGLVFTVYATAIDPKRGSLGTIAPIAIGFIVGANILAGGPFDGASMNPARAFGPALVGWRWTDHWIFWVGPLLGAAIAGPLYELVMIPAESPLPHQPLAPEDY